MGFAENGIKFIVESSKRNFSTAFVTSTAALSSKGEGVIKKRDYQEEERNPRNLGYSPFFKTLSWEGNCALLSAPKNPVDVNCLKGMKIR